MATTVSNWFVANAPLLAILISLASAVTSVASYRRAARVKAFDVRVEVRKSEESLRLLVKGLRPMIDHASQSRKRVLNAQGLGRSGNEIHWQQQVAEDMIVLSELEGAVPASQPTHALTDLNTLADRLVELHSLQTRGRSLQEKYVAALAADDRAREIIRSEAGRLHS